MWHLRKFEKSIYFKHFCWKTKSPGISRHYWYLFYPKNVHRFHCIQEPMDLFALCFWSDDAGKITFFFPENCHCLNLFLTSVYFLCSVQETFPAKPSTEGSTEPSTEGSTEPSTAELDVTVQGSSVPAHFNSCHATNFSWNKNIFSVVSSPLSSNPWVISCPITIPIPPKFRAWGWCLLKKGGWRIPAGKTAKTGRKREILWGGFVFASLADRLFAWYKGQEGTENIKWLEISSCLLWNCFCLDKWKMTS